MLMQHAGAFNFGVQASDDLSDAGSIDEEDSPDDDGPKPWLKTKSNKANEMY